MERILIIMRSFTTGSTVAVAARGRLDLCIDFDGCCFCFSLLATFGASVLATALRRLPSSGSGLVFYMCLCSSRPLLHAACSTTMRSRWNFVPLLHCCSLNEHRQLMTVLTCSATTVAFSPSGFT